MVAFVLRFFVTTFHFFFIAMNLVYVQETFTTNASDGGEVELCRNGAQVKSNLIIDFSISQFLLDIFSIFFVATCDECESKRVCNACRGEEKKKQNKISICNYESK